MSVLICCQVYSPRPLPPAKRETQFPSVACSAVTRSSLSTKNLSNSEWTRAFFFPLLFYPLAFVLSAAESEAGKWNFNLACHFSIVRKDSWERYLLFSMAQWEGERGKLFQEFPLQSIFSHRLACIFKDLEIKEPAALEQEACCTSKGQVGLRQPLLTVLFCIHTAD